MVAAKSGTTPVREERTRTATGYMLIAVLGSSLIPLTIALGQGAQNPFLFNGILGAGAVLGYLAFLSLGYRRLFWNRAVWVLVGRRVFSHAILLGVISNFNYVLVAWAAQYIDISVAAMLFEAWLIFAIIFQADLFKRDGRFGNIDFTLLATLTLGLLGLGYVIASQSGELFMSLVTIPNYSLLVGSFLALAAAAIGGLGVAFSSRWGIDLSQDLIAIGYDERSIRSLELPCIIICYGVGNLIAILPKVVLGIVSTESLAAGTFVFGILGGIFLAITAICWRQANLVTNNLGVNALWYSTPIFTLAWLFTFYQVTVVRPDYLVIGAAAIILANLLKNFAAEVRIGFKSLIIALWVCGVLVYLRPVDGSFLIIDDWIWTGTSYFQALALAATVFTLILSFRVARLVSRTTEEENRTFTLFQNLDLLVHRNVLSPDVRNHILTIDVSEQKPRELKRAYDRIMTCITEASANDATDEDRRLLSEATAELNSLVHSKQHGLVIGELFALYIFAGISVFISLFARPDVTGWTAFLVETFAMLFSAVVIFLISNVHDLQKARIAGILTQTKRGDYGVVFRNVQARAFEQWLSVVIIVVLGVGYGWLLWAKWIQ